MPIYWSILLLSFLLFVFGTRTKEFALKNGEFVYFTKSSIVWLGALYILFFAGLRDQIIDTSGYIKSFYYLPNDFATLSKVIEEMGSGSGFHYIAGFFKIIISDNHYMWLSFVAAISLFFLLRTYRKYSCDYGFTFYLFVASTSFTWLFNGIRQFLVVCILIGMVDWLLSCDKRKKIYYLILMLLLSRIHNSELFVIPLCYICSRGKLLDKWMLGVVLATIVMTIASDSVMETAFEVMNKDYDSLEEGTGSSIARFLVSTVPLCLTMYKLKEVRETASPFYVFAINMSLVGSCFFLAATFTSGLLVGRMPIYFTIYNYILIPWLLKHFYRNMPIVRNGCIVFYLLFFYFQMCIAWRNLEYVSDILGISYWGSR